MTKPNAKQPAAQSAPGENQDGERYLDLLRREQGATLDELVAATGSASPYDPRGAYRLSEEGTRRSKRQSAETRPVIG